jgi:hypothetical protein
VRIALPLPDFVLTSLGIALTVCWVAFIGIPKYGALPSGVGNILAHWPQRLFFKENRKCEPAVLGKRLMCKATLTHPMCSHSKTIPDSGQPLDFICLPKPPHKGLYALLRPYSHRPEVVARAIMDYNAQPMTKDQYLATKEYERLLCCMNRPPEDVELLYEFLKVFDRLFFFGALTRFCFLEVVPHEEGVLGEAFGARSEYYGHEKVRKPFQVKIEIINRTDDSEVQEPRERLLAYVETLLHECIHAMFIVYVCLAKQDCQERKWEALGDSGHLTAWQDAALVVECASVHLYPRRLSLNREHSYWEEIAQSGRHINDSQLEDWGFADSTDSSDPHSSSPQNLLGSVPENTYQDLSPEE